MKKFLTPLFVLLINLQPSTYAWIATLRVMQHPNGHIVRLAGDIHLQGFTYKSSLKNEVDLGRFFSSSFANFGYLTFIACNTHKNITLYLGADHCYNLAKDLKEIGYYTIFEKGLYDESDLFKNIIPCPRSKKEYKTFFEIQ